MPKFIKEENELETHFDKSLYVINNLPKFHERPKKLQEKVFEKLFSEAEIAKLKPEDMKAYEESLKVYRDNENTMDYAISTAVKEAVKEAVREAIKERDIEIVQRMKQKGIDIQTIIETTGLTKKEIEELGA